MKFEILPHRWTNKWGSKCIAKYYPFINGNPAPELATCTACRFYNTNLSEGYCDAWRDEPENAPWFCGPICNKFTLAKGIDEGNKLMTIDQLVQSKIDQALFLVCEKFETEIELLQRTIGAIHDDLDAMSEVPPVPKPVTVSEHLAERVRVAESLVEQARIAGIRADEESVDPDAAAVLAVEAWLYKHSWYGAAKAIREQVAKDMEG